MLLSTAERCVSMLLLLLMLVVRRRVRVSSHYTTRFADTTRLVTTTTTTSDSVDQLGHHMIRVGIIIGYNRITICSHFFFFLFLYFESPSNVLLLSRCTLGCRCLRILLVYFLTATNNTCAAIAWIRITVQIIVPAEEEIVLLVLYILRFFFFFSFSFTTSLFYLFLLPGTCCC